MHRPASPSPGVASAVLAWLGFFLLIATHFTVRPLLRGPVVVDFALIALLFASVRMRPGLAAVTGFALGLGLDALSPDHFGATTLVLSLIGYGASWLKAAFFGDDLAVIALFLCGGKWLADLALALLTGAPWGGSLLASILLWSPLSAALSAGVALVLLTLFRPLYRPVAR